MHPRELKIIVYCARNLQPKKKGAVCQASVIFGVGRDKYRTEVVKGNNPTWNEEGVINVSNPNASLILTVMDHEESLGNITLPVVNLPSAAHKRRWLPLKRKHQQTSSDLCFDCWITQFKKDNIWNKLNPFSSSIPSPQEKRRESIASASIGIRGSTSSCDLYSKSLEEDERESRNENTSDARRRLSSSGKSSSTIDLTTDSPRAPPSPPAQELSMVKPKLLPSLGAVMSMKGPPEITGISPRFGPSSGGTKITIRGCNLGTNTGDILGFTICSCDHLDSLEHHTPAKLVCTTQPWDGKKPNPGPILLVTKSGGRGVSTIKFQFQGDPVVTKKNYLTAKENNRKETKNSKNEPPVEVENLRRNVQDLRSENQSLRSYIDKLMVVLMEKYPDALEATMSNDTEKS